METTVFIAVGVPVLVLSMASIAATSLFFLRHIPNPLTHYLRLAVLVQVLMVFLQIFWLVLSMSASYINKGLPEDPPNGIYKKFLKPIGGEGFRVFIIAVSTALISSGDSFDIFHAYAIATVYAINFTFAYCSAFSPFNYARRYARFLHQHSIYESSKSLNKPPITALDPECLPHPIQVDDSPKIKPVFNLESFDIPRNLTHHKLMPILIQNSQQAHLDMIDRLYAVSPRNTIHLQLDAGYNDDRASSVNATNSLSPSCNLGSTETYIDFEGSTDPIFKDLKPKETLCNSLSEHSSLLSSSSSGANDKSSRRKIKDIFIWFRWILPISVTGPKDKIITNPSPYQVRRSLHKKFSTYTLNSETLSLKGTLYRPLYSTIDLEINSPCESTRKNVHEFYRFASFSNKYLDSAHSSSGTCTSAVDPSYLKFGELMTELPVFYFILYGMSNILRHFAYTLTLSLIFLLPNLCGLEVTLIGLTVILKLFSHNYLHQQSTSSYNHSIIADFCIMMSLFCIVFSSCFCILSG